MDFSDTSKKRQEQEQRQGQQQETEHHQQRQQRGPEGKFVAMERITRRIDGIVFETVQQADHVLSSNMVITQKEISTTPIPLSDGTFFPKPESELEEKVFCTVCYDRNRTQLMHKESASYCSVGNHWCCRDCGEVIVEGDLSFFVCINDAPQVLRDIGFQEEQAAQRSLLKILFTWAKPKEGV